MSLYGNKDQANNVPKFAPLIVGKHPTANTVASLYANAATTSVFGIDVAEKAATDGPQHAGWNLRKVGTGGRAGRIQYETLVAMGSMTLDGDNGVIPSVRVKITTQPANTAVVGANAFTFAVVGSTTPNTAMTYQWQANTGTGYANLTNTGVYSNTTTATLAGSAGTGLNGTQYRVLVSAPNGNTITSKAATLTVN